MKQTLVAVGASLACLATASGAPAAWTPVRDLGDAQTSYASASFLTDGELLLTTSSGGRARVQRILTGPIGGPYLRGPTVGGLCCLLASAASPGVITAAGETSGETPTEAFRVAPGVAARRVAVPAGDRRLAVAGAYFGAQVLDARGRLLAAGPASAGGVFLRSAGRPGVLSRPTLVSRHAYDAGDIAVRDGRIAVVTGIDDDEVDVSLGSLARGFGAREHLSDGTHSTDPLRAVQTAIAHGGAVGVIWSDANPEVPLDGSGPAFTKVAVRAPGARGFSPPTTLERSDLGGDASLIGLTAAGSGFLAAWSSGGPLQLRRLTRAGAVQTLPTPAGAGGDEFVLTDGWLAYVDGLQRLLIARVGADARPGVPELVATAGMGEQLTVDQLLVDPRTHRPTLLWTQEQDVAGGDVRTFAATR